MIRVIQQSHDAFMAREEFILICDCRFSWNEYVTDAALLQCTKVDFFCRKCGTTLRIQVGAGMRTSQGHYSPGGGASRPTSQSSPTGAKVFWSPADSLWVAQFPYDADVVTKIKDVCERKAFWKKEHKCWLFPEKYLQGVKELLEKSFGYCDFKPRPEHRQAPTIASSNGANPWREFINLLGLDIMSSAYKSGMKKNHPDMGGDAAVAAKLNMLWDALKGELK